MANTAFSNYWSAHVLERFFSDGYIHLSLHSGDPGTTGANEITTSANRLTWGGNATAAINRAHLNDASFLFEGVSGSATHVGLWANKTDGWHFVCGGKLSTPLLADNLNRIQVLKKDIAVYFGSQAIVGQQEGTHLLVLGGGSTTMEIFDGTSWTYTSASLDMDIDTAGSQVRRLLTDVYIMGGWGTNKVRKYDPVADTIDNAYTTLPNANTEWTSGQVATDEERYIYIFGGIADGVRLSSAYRLDTQSGTWTTLASLPQIMNNGSAFFYKGKFVITGHNPSVSDSLRTYLYNPQTDSYSSLAVQPISISAIHNNGPYTKEVGYYIADDAAGYPHYYDFASDSWTAMPRLVNSGASSALVNIMFGRLGNKIYAVGGASSATTKSLWWWAPGEAGWTFLNHNYDMNVARSRGAVVDIYL